MYSSSYSQAKFGLEGREPLHRSKGKSCGYYLRIMFFFSSLIQSLIIVSLVLFLIYGQPEKSAAEKRVKELELTYNRLTENNIQLRKEKGELGSQLGARTAEKAALEKECEKLRTDFNKTVTDLKTKSAFCEKQLTMSRVSSVPRCPTPALQQPVVNFGSEMKTLQTLNAQQKAMINLIEANFTQTVQYLSQERDMALKDRDTHLLDAITLRRDNGILKEQHSTYTRKCKEDFAHSLDGIQTVTTNFLNRINNLFPHQLTFHLTCESQQEQMEKIRNSCTNLSREVENKFQLYLDNVGNKVSEIQSLSSRLEVQNSYLNGDLQQCEKKHSETVAESRMQLQLKQKTHDEKMERLLMEQNRLREEKKLQEDRLTLKERELQTLKGMIAGQPNCKLGLSKPAGMQAEPPQSRQTVPSWPSGGAPGKAPTVR